MPTLKKRRTRLGKTACQGAGQEVFLGFGPSRGATVRRPCSVCDQSVRVLRSSDPQRGHLAKHKRALSEDEWAERQASRPLPRPSRRRRRSSLAA